MLRYTIPAEAQRGGHAVFAAEGFSAAYDYLNGGVHTYSRLQHDVRTRSMATPFRHPLLNILGSAHADLFFADPSRAPNNFKIGGEDGFSVTAYTESTF